MAYGPFQHLYPYSNFHDLNLDWVINTVKQLAAEWASTEQAWVTQQEAFNSLKSFVENYFENLDVQDEINEKINSMVEDGTLETIIGDIFAGSTSPVFVSSTSEMTDHSKQYVLTTDPDGHIYFWNGSNFAESDVLFGNTNSTLKYIQVVGNSVNPVDFDTLTTYGNYWISTNSSGQTVSNAPPDYKYGYGALMVYGYDPSDGPLSVVLQVYMSTDNTKAGDNKKPRMYQRAKLVSGTWTNWNEISTDTDPFYSFKGYYNNASEALDLNAFTEYGNYWIYAISGRQPLSNLPDDFPSGTASLQVLGYDVEDAQMDFVVQILIGTANNRVYVRSMLNSTWGEWQKILIEGFSDDYILSLVQKMPRDYTPDFGGILEFMAVGDSLTDGYTADATKVVARCRDHSWPAFIERKYGVTAHWAAKAGVTAKAWLSDPDCFTVMNSTPAQTMYFVSLCTNDASDVENTPLGTVADCGTDANSFYAYYYKVLQAIRTHAPNAFIFTTGSPVGSRSQAHALGFETAISEVTEKFENAAFLDTYDMIKESVIGYSSTIAGHYTSVGYSILANIYNEAIAKYLSEHPKLNIAAPEITSNPT